MNSSDNKNKEVKVENSTKKKLIVVMIVIIIILLLLFAYAYFSIIITGTGKSITGTSQNNLRLTFTDGAVITDSNMIPGDTLTKTFSVYNNGDRTTTYSLYWSCIENTFSRTSDLTYTLTSTNGGATKTSTTYPTVAGADIGTNISIASGVTQTYTLTVTYARLTTTDQSVDMAKRFIGVINIYSRGIEKRLGCSFADTLMADNPPTTYATVPGRVASTTDEGLIEGPNDDYGAKTYYFRGTAPDNYVTFAGKTWRVVRINGNGSVRLVLNTTTGTYSAWNTNNASTTWSTALSYATYGNSTIKEAVDNWYNTNIGNNTNYSSKVVESKFCNDRTYIGGETEGADFGAYNRLYPNHSITNANPSYICPDSTHIYNLNVGLLTADEVAFAGGTSHTYNQSYYLYKSGSWWTLSPYRWYVPSGNVYAWHVISDGDLYESAFGLSVGVLPVISLSSEVTITTASPTNPGTSANPYVVE